MATPSDLIKDAGTTPFNVGRRIEINDFTPAEAAPLARGLQVGQSPPAAERSRELLARVLYWTEGHPYLTQKMCRVAAEALRGTNATTRYARLSAARFIDQVCAELFFAPGAPSRDDNLIFVRDRLLRDRQDRAEVLDLYRKVWQGRKVKDDELDPTIKLLCLSGVARVANHRLRERNPIYQRVFNKEWIRANMPDAELRRQREAYRHGVIRTASVSALIIFALIALSLVAIHQTTLANLAEAKAWRSSGQMGQRIKALMAIQRVKRWGTFFSKTTELRNEAIAALNLVDLEERAPLDGSGRSVLAPEIDQTFSRYAEADQDGAVRVIKVQRKEVERELPPVGLPVRWLRFGSLSDYLVVGYGRSDGGEQRCILWRISDRSKCLDLREEVARDAWDLTPGGERLAIGFRQNEIRLYSFRDGAPVIETTLGAGEANVRRVACLRFDPSGTRLAECIRAGIFLYVWDLTLNEKKQYAHPDAVVDMDWHPSGDQLATALKNGDIYLLDLRTEVKERLHQTAAQLVSPRVSFNHAGTVLATVCSDLSLRLWRPQNRHQILASYQMAEMADLDTPACLRFSADDRHLALHTMDRRVRLFDVQGGNELITFHGGPDTAAPFKNIEFDFQGRLLIGAGPLAGISLWDASAPRKPLHLQLRGLVATVAMDPSGSALYATTTSGFYKMPVQLAHQSEEDELRIEPVQRLTARGGLGPFKLTTNGLAAVVHAGENEDHIHTFKIADPDHCSRWDAGCKLDTIAISPEGRWLAACAIEKPEILVWDAFSHGSKLPFTRLSGSRHFSFSPSGKWLVTAVGEEFQFHKVGSWNERSHASVARTKGFGQFSPVTFVAVPTNGLSLMALATSPTTIELFRFSDGNSPGIEKLVKLESPDQLPIVHLAFNRSGGRLAAASEGQIVQVWDLAAIREQLDERSLAAGFPHFAPRSNGKLRVVINPSKQTDAERLVEDQREERLIKLDILNERIESTPADQPGKFFEYLIERGRVYRSLGNFKMAQHDFSKAKKLKPMDKQVLDEVERTNQERNVYERQDKPD